MRRVELTKRVPQNPVELAAELGLTVAQVQSVTVSDNDVSVDFADSVNWPDAVLKDKLEKAYNRKVK